MGFLGKKRKTEVFTEKLTGTKIVKLSYIQSLIVSGSVAPASDYAGTSNPTSVSFDATKKKETNPFLLGLGGYTAAAIPLVIAGIGATIIGSVVALAAIVLGIAFGKKKKVETNVTIKESGWNIVKTWAQPQFDIIRYAIGIKDINISQFNYEMVSEMVSTPWVSPKEVVKIYMLADQFIPSEFPPGAFVEYYIKPDIQDFKWIRINPMELPSQYTADGTIVPRIISFNSERPISARLEESYVSTKDPVRAVRVKIVLKRPSTVADSYTPIVRSYRLVMTPQGGL